MKSNFPILVYFFASIIVVGFIAKSLDVLVDRAEPASTPMPVNANCIDVPPGDEYRCECFNGQCLWIQN